MATKEGEERDRLFEEIYEDLRRLAKSKMRAQRPDELLQTTALVNEACLKFLGREGLADCERSHVLALAAKAMRQVLVDHARARGSLKRPTHAERVPLEGLALAYEGRSVDLLALDAALERLASFDPGMAQAVELRYFGGLSVDDTALALGIKKRTLERRYEAVERWLRAEIE